MIHSTIETWANNTIADALYETKVRHGSILAFAILELGTELIASNLCVLEYAGRSVTHILASPFSDKFSLVVGLNYLVEGIWKLAVAALFDNFIILVAAWRILKLDGNKTLPLFTGPTNTYNQKYVHSGYRTA